MAKSKDAWAGFKPEGKLPDYSGDKLHKAWKELHAGDGEPWPDDKRAAALIKAAGKAAPKGLDAKALAAARLSSGQGSPSPACSSFQALCSFSPL